MSAIVWRVDSPPPAVRAAGNRVLARCRLALQAWPENVLWYNVAPPQPADRHGWLCTAILTGEAPHIDVQHVTHPDHSAEREQAIEAYFEVLRTAGLRPIHRTYRTGYPHLWVPAFVQPEIAP